MWGRGVWSEARAYKHPLTWPTRRRRREAEANTEYTPVRVEPESRWPQVPTVPEGGRREALGGAEQRERGALLGHAQHARHVLDAHPRRHARLGLCKRSPRPFAGYSQPYQSVHSDQPLPECRSKKGRGTQSPLQRGEKEPLRVLSIFRNPTHRKAGTGKPCALHCRKAWPPPATSMRTPFENSLLTRGWTLVTGSTSANKPINGSAGHGGCQTVA